MAKLGIYVFGHGGGVPGAIPGTPVVNAGNTNFALIPDLGINLAPTGDIVHTAGDIRVWEPTIGNWVGILADNPYYLIDCGPETMLHLCGVLGGNPATKNLQGILLTHTHDDHSGGIKSLAYRTRFIDGTKPKLIYPPDLWPILKHQMTEFAYLNPTVHERDHGPHFFYHLTPSVTFDSPQFKARSFPVDHNCVGPDGSEFPAFGYQVKTSAGKTIVFSGDTAEPLHADLITGADLVIHDVQFYNDGSKGDHVHCPYAWLRDAVPPEHRHKVLLTHTAHDLPPEAVADGFRLLRGGSMILADA